MSFSIPAGGTAGMLLMTVFLVVAIALTTAVWVYRDAHASAKRGRPVTSRVGSFHLKKPLAWFVACLLLWEMAFPLYMDSRHPA